MRGIVTIGPLNERRCAQLAHILATDTALLESLGRPDPRPLSSGAKLYAELKTWQEDNAADSYAIMRREAAIGLISLSHQNGTHAHIGYWLASREWGKGYASQAFELLLATAKQRGFIELSASIDPANIASLRMWSNVGATLTQSDRSVVARLRLS